MGIANELSSDVAAAVLARKDHEQAGTNELVEIVRNFHDAMRDLTGEERRRRIYASSSSESAQANAQTASGRP
jgi:hypothetical protein